MSRFGYVLFAIVGMLGEPPRVCTASCKLREPLHFGTKPCPWKMSGDTRGSKRRQLLQFNSRLPHVSQSALASVLKEVKLGNVPELGQERHHIRGARNDFCSQATPFGKIHQTVEVVDGVSLEVQMPSAFLWSLRESCAFNQLLERAKVLQFVFKRVVYNLPLVFRVFSCMIAQATAKAISNRISPFWFQHLGL